MSISINMTDKVMGQDLNIPTIPEVFARISSMAQDPDVGLQEIGKVVAQDPPLATKVLQIVNSASYGLHQNIVSCEHATSVLGVRALKNVVLQASVMSDFAHLNRLFDLSKIWIHSILSAQVAANIATNTRASLPIGVDEIYTCGLLHNIGTMVLLDCGKEDYVELLKSGDGTEQVQWELEEEAFGFTHCEVGAMVARRWDLPKPVIAAVLHHHDPTEAKDDSALACLVQLASRLAFRANPDAPNLDADFPSLDAQRELGLTQKSVEDFFAFAQEALPLIEL